jgi:hypothetical protein
VTSEEKVREQTMNEWAPHSPLESCQNDMCVLQNKRRGDAVSFEEQQLSKTQ